MTDIPKLPLPVSFTATPARVLRFPAKFLKSLFRSRREATLDLAHAPEHILRDLGVRRPPAEPPRIVSLDRLW